jgi:hypothetical protein
LNYQQINLEYLDILKRMCELKGHHNIYLELSKQFHIFELNYQQIYQ